MRPSSFAAVTAVVVVGCGRVGFDAGPFDRPDASCSPAIDFDSDAENCGRCGHSCLGASCNAGACGAIELTPFVGALRGLYIASGYVYFSSPGAIRKIPIDGGPIEIVTMFSGTAFRLIEHDGYLYWHTRDTGAVARAPITGGPAEIFESGELDPSGIATDGTAIYWGQYVAGTPIHRTPIDGSPRMDLTAPSTSTVTCVRLAGTTLYYIEEDIGLFRVDTDGSNPTMIAAAGTYEVIIDGDDAYLETLGHNHVAKVSLSTGLVTELGDSNGLWGIALDDTYVYVANESGNTITRVLRTGGVTEILATAQNPVGIAVDDSAVYWTQPAGGLYKIAK